MIGELAIVGVGPGDPELLTLKAVRSISLADVVFVPSSHLSRESWMRDAVELHAARLARIEEVSFSAACDPQQRKLHWLQTATEICALVRAGKRVVFVTLGDPQLYSTSFYLLQALKDVWSELPLQIVPGISSFSHAAALSHVPLGTGTEPLRVFPSIKGIDEVRSALDGAGTLVLMKIGKRLPEIIALLEECNLLDSAVFVARAGLAGQRVETDLRRLRDASSECGNLSVMLIHIDKV
jgi:precorrin-2/cobalt-factor-2 C20-methyltransferase